MIVAVVTCYLGALFGASLVEWREGEVAWWCPAFLAVCAAVALTDWYVTM